MPVFADEAIYIRWAQLIIDDWQRYLFFCLNDGKTPLFIWLLLPFLKLFTDQLLAGRVLAVLVGAIQLFVIKELIKAFRGGKKAQIIGMILTCILPFWYFHHRVALMDGMMTLLISFSILFLIKLRDSLESKKLTFKVALFTALSGAAFGAAILTKLPAIFIAPIFVVISVFPFSHKSSPQRVKQVSLVGLAGAIGVLLFLLLKLNPAFGQLFARGQSFTYTVQELMHGEWMSSLRNFPRFATWGMYYLTPSVLFVCLAGMVHSKHKRAVVFLMIASALFCGPFLILGKTVYPRYLLPVSVFITVSSSLVFESWLEEHKHEMIAGFLLLLTVLWSSYFILTSLININMVPYVAIDREQYQTEWSAGYGVREAVNFIQDQAKSGRVVVATEGYFGTLPDGILLYLHNQDVTNIEVYGIGEPIRAIPKDLLQKSLTARKTYIMVNSHRMFVADDPRLRKVESFPRPFGAPSFDIYEVVATQ